MLLSPAFMTSIPTSSSLGLALLLLPPQPAWARSEAPARPPVQAPASAPAKAGTPTAANQPTNFDRPLRLLFRMVACAGAEPVPAELQAVVAEHCALFEKTMADYRTKYVAMAQPFLLGLQPKGLPSTVVYPFGGGDLVSALTTYPGLTEVTTLSLEHAGDPRRVVGITPERLRLSLSQVRRRVSGLLIWTESTSENMMQLQQGDLPGQLAFFLTGLAVHGMEPVSLRFFRLAPHGAPVYLDTAEIGALESSTATKLNTVWKSPDFSVAFSNSELTFRKAGDPSGALRVHRHIAADLSDTGLKKFPGVLRHLEAKGRVSAIVKAASYLLWGSGFSGIRDYLLAHMEFMLSDSTGIPPRFARKAGFEVLPYGQFDGPFLLASAAEAKEMVTLFETPPRRELNFRYGYPDSHRHHHLLVTRRPPEANASR
jgi:hypothetical protein